MNRDDLIRGKTRLDVAKYAIDSSGKDFENVYLESSQTLSHSFFNGASLRNCAFLGAPIDQTEFAEAQITKCYFENTDFTGTSFIGATIEGTTFQNCNFSDGEWRQSHFSTVKFIGCDFNYTTVNLCRFDECEFTGENARRLDNRSVNYNVFSRSNFDFSIADEMVLASNFGFPGQEKARSLTNYGAGITIEEICLQSGSGHTVVSDFIAAIENEFASAKIARLRTLRLEFISNIISALALTSRISPTSLTYLEMLFAELTQSATNESHALAAVRAMLNVRKFLFEMAEEDFYSAEHARRQCLRIDISYERTYTRSDATELAHVLGRIATGRPNTFRVSSFETGSTIVEMIATSAVTVGATLMAIRFALRQANKVTQELHELRANLAKLVKPVVKRLKREKSKRSKALVSALGAADSVNELLVVRQIVRRYGKQVVLLDDRAAVIIYYSPSK